MSVIAAFVYLSGSLAGGSGICSRGISAAPVHYSWDRETPWRDHPRYSRRGKLKEWAYAGFTFACISACVAHDLAKDGPVVFMPLISPLASNLSGFLRSFPLAALRPDSQTIRHVDRSYYGLSDAKGHFVFLL